MNFLSQVGLALALYPPKRQVLEQAGGDPAAMLVATGPLRLRPKMLLITHRWSLKGLAIEGETLVIGHTDIVLQNVYV